MCYNCDFGLTEDESSCDECEEVHACRGPRVITPEELTALSRAVTCKPVSSGSSSSSINRLLDSTVASTNVEEGQGQFQGE